MLDKGVVVFLDDILGYSIIAEEHFELLVKVFICLPKYALYCKLKKCKLLQKTNTNLEFNATTEGMRISSAKIRSLKEWLKPTTIQWLQPFLGFV